MKTIVGIRFKKPGKIYFFDPGDIEFKLKEYQDFSWVNDYGIVFSVIDETGSGCISFGVQKDNKKYFIKITSKTIKKVRVNIELKELIHYKNKE